MKVILLQDVKGLGKKDAVIEVAEGYARNFLLPKKAAEEANTVNMKKLEHKKQAEKQKEANLLNEAKELAKKIDKLNIKITAKTGDGGRLFGSITAKDIADRIKANAGIDLDKRKLEMAEAIKVLGTYQIQVKLHKDVTAKLTVSVTAE